MCACVCASVVLRVACLTIGAALFRRGILPFVCVVIAAKLFVNGRERVQTDVNKLRPCVCTMLNGVSWHAKKSVITCRFGWNYLPLQCV